MVPKNEGVRLEKIKKNSRDRIWHEIENFPRGWPPLHGGGTRCIITIYIMQSTVNQLVITNRVHGFS